MTRNRATISPLIDGLTESLIVSLEGGGGDPPGPPLPNLTLTVPASAAENAGTVACSVARDGDTTDALVVTLSSSDTGEATVPATVTILATQSSVNFDLTAVNDGIVDTDVVVTITASATDYNGDTADITITDVGAPPIYEQSNLITRPSGFSYFSGFSFTWDTFGGAARYFAGSSNGQYGVEASQVFNVTAGATYTLHVNIPTGANGGSWRIHDASDNSAVSSVILSASAGHNEVDFVAPASGQIKIHVDAVWDYYNHVSDLAITLQGVDPSWQ